MCLVCMCCLANCSLSLKHQQQVHCQQCTDLCSLTCTGTRMLLDLSLGAMPPPTLFLLAEEMRVLRVLMWPGGRVPCLLLDMPTPRLDWLTMLWLKNMRHNFFDAGQNDVAVNPVWHITLISSCLVKTDYNKQTPHIVLAMISGL